MTDESKFIEYLENRFDNRYVRKRDCDQKSHSNEEHIQRLEITMAKVGTKLSIMIGILGAIGVAMLTVVIKILFGG